MVTLSVTLADPNPRTTPIYTFCVAFHIFEVDEHRDFKFGVQADHSKSQPTEERQTIPKRGVVTSRNLFKFGN